MTSLNVIRTIAIFEAKTLVRGWFFRIFAILVLLFEVFFNLFGYTTLFGGGGWPGRLLPGVIPYMNLFIINLAQAIIAVFLASDFLGRDKKLDTTEVFYVRSMSNSAYVFGKMGGVLLVLGVLNVIVLFIGLVINFITPDIILVPHLYLIYPLLISLPTLLFVLGLSFALMVIIRNQAVVFIIVLGFIGVTLFFLSDKLNGVFGFISFDTPLQYSLFSGLSDLTNLLLLRSGFVLWGLSFVFLTIYLLPRLPQERFFKLLVPSGIFLCVALALVFHFTYVSNTSERETLRLEMNLVEKSLPFEPSVSIIKQEIDINHNGTSLEVKALLNAILLSSDTVNLALNSGFDLKSLKVDGREVDFSRHYHLIRFRVNGISPQQHFKIELLYNGAPNNNGTFKDVNEKQLERINRLDPVVAGKEIAFVQSDYVLLTRESMWYPVSAFQYHMGQPQFSEFQLTVKTNPELKVLSQGKTEVMGDGLFKFTPSSPLNALSLVAGNYNVRTIKVDDVDVSLWLHPKNKLANKYFNLIVDTIPNLLADMKSTYERRIGITYPFERYNIVEVPIHFYSYSRNWTLATEDNMPEMAFVPEMGGNVSELNFSRQNDRIVRDNKTSKEALLPKELQVRLFKNIVGGLLFEPGSMSGTSSFTRQRKSGWGKQMIFPQYTNYVNGISQSGFPILQCINESYVFTELQQSAEHSSGTSDGGNSDQILMKLKGLNLNQILEKMKDDNRLQDIISKKGTQLFATMQAHLQPNNIGEVLKSVNQDNQFKLMTSQFVIDTLSAISQYNLMPVYDQWTANNLMPAYLFGRTEVYEVLIDNRANYFIKSQIANNGMGDGYISIGIRTQGRDRNRGSGNATQEQTFEIKAKQQVEIGIVVKREPREMVINTFVADNMPSTQRLLLENVLNNPVVPFEGTRPFNGTITHVEPYEVVVDNEDSSFYVLNQKNSNTVKDWWMLRNVDVYEDKYSQINFYRPSVKWQSTLSSTYFGKYVKSAHYKASGTGLNYAKWQGTLSVSGNYSIYTYLPPPMRQRGGGRNSETVDNTTYTYEVIHDDGKTAVVVNMADVTGGWFYLGDFYISKGKAEVRLLDKSERPVVIADAIKWVRKK